MATRVVVMSDGEIISMNKRLAASPLIVTTLALSIAAPAAFAGK